MLRIHRSNDTYTLSADDSIHISHTTCSAASEVVSVSIPGGHSCSILTLPHLPLRTFNSLPSFISSMPNLPYPDDSSDTFTNTVLSNHPQFVIIPANFNFCSPFIALTSKSSTCFILLKPGSTATLNVSRPPHFATDHIFPNPWLFHSPPPTLRKERKRKAAPQDCKLCGLISQQQSIKQSFDCSSIIFPLHQISPLHHIAVPNQHFTSVACMPAKMRDSLVANALNIGIEGLKDSQESRKVILFERFFSKNPLNHCFLDILPINQDLIPLIFNTLKIKLSELHHFVLNSLNDFNSVFTGNYYVFFGEVLVVNGEVNDVFYHVFVDHQGLGVINSSLLYDVVGPFLDD
ncbi:hypothetical protein P9112_014262 [Eukaryota sp. TZLM1-RC]